MSRRVASAALWQARRCLRAARRRRSSQVPTAMRGPSAAKIAMKGLHTSASTSPATTGSTMPTHPRGSCSGGGGGSAGTSSVAGCMRGPRRGGRLNGILPAAAPMPARIAAGMSSTGSRHCREVAPRANAHAGRNGRRTPDGTARDHGAVARAEVGYDRRLAWPAHGDAGVAPRDGRVADHHIAVLGPADHPGERACSRDARPRTQPAGDPTASGRGPQRQAPAVCHQVYSRLLSESRPGREAAPA